MLDTTPWGLFHRKERKTLEDRIAGIGRQIDLTRTQLEMLRNDAGFGPRKEFQKGFQRDLYNLVIKKTKEIVYEELTDLLAKASWMSE